MTKVADFEVHHTAFLGPDGEPLQRLPKPYESRETVVELYRDMVFARAFDAKAIALQRTGRLGTYASMLGQEAVGVGVGHAMRADDVLLPSFREHALQLARGVSPEEILLYWGGDERGSAFAGPREDFPVCITVAGHAPHAAGVALALQLSGEPRAAVCVLGDGATSKGDFYEALNVAGAWELPVVFVVTNNQWAISTPRSHQTASETLAQKAIAGGFVGEQVDGNDVIAVSSTVAAALVSARRGDGPRLVECLTYRLGDHTTVDDASRYRDDAEVSRRWQLDPLVRMRLYLTHAFAWGKADEEALLSANAQAIERAVDAYLGMPPPAAESVFDYLYATLPDSLRAQREEYLAHASTLGTGDADG